VASGMRGFPCLLSSCEIVHEQGVFSFECYARAYFQPEVEGIAFGSGDVQRFIYVFLRFDHLDILVAACFKSVLEIRSCFNDPSGRLKD